MVNKGDHGDTNDCLLSNKMENNIHEYSVCAFISTARYEDNSDVVALIDGRGGVLDMLDEAGVL